MRIYRAGWAAKGNKRCGHWWAWIGPYVIGWGLGHMINLKARAWAGFYTTDQQLREAAKGTLCYHCGTKWTPDRTGRHHICYAAVRD